MPPRVSLWAFYIATMLSTILPTRNRTLHGATSHCYCSCHALVLRASASTLSATEERCSLTGLLNRQYGLLGNSFALFVGRSPRLFGFLSPTAYRDLLSAHHRRQPFTHGREPYYKCRRWIRTIVSPLAGALFPLSYTTQACICRNAQTLKRSSHDTSIAPSVTPQATRTCCGSHP